MKNNPFNLHRRIALVASAFVGVAIGLGSSGAFAAGTVAGTTISNLATLSYAIGAVSQPAIGSSATGNTSGAGTATTFLVDRKVNLILVKQGATATSVTPGQTTAVSTFLLTNLGNDVQDFSIAGVNMPTGTVDPFGGVKTDNFDASACVVRVDGNSNGTYEAANDTATYVDELPADGTRTVFVLCDIPATQVNGDFAVGSVTATTLVGGAPGAQGAVITQTAGADTAGVDTVFADGAGTDDAARSGTYSDRNAFLVAAATLSVSKSAQLLCDPFNGTTNPKNIPGSIVRWTITVSNSAGAGASATLAQVADALSVNTTFDPNLVVPTTAANCSSATGTPESATGKGFKLNVTGSTRPGPYPKFLTNAADSDGGTYAVPNVTIDYSQAMPIETGYGAGELKPGESVTVYFNATIN
jgi:hypothetical protein